MGSSIPARLPRLIVLSALFAAAAPPARGQAPRDTTRPDPSAAIEPTTAVLVVDAPAGAPDADALLQRRINTHAASLLSGHNLRRALARPNVRSTRWFKETDDPAERLAFLRDRLRVAPLPGTALITVSLDAVRDPAERAGIVEEVCNAYFDLRRADRSNQILDRTAMLNNAKIKAEMRLKDLTSEMREKQIELNLDGGGIGRVGVKEMELSRLVGEQIQAQLHATRAKARFDALQAAFQAGKEPQAATAAAENDPAVRALRARADEAEARAEALAAAAANADPRDDALPQLKATAEQLRKRADTRRTEALARAKVAALEDARAEYEMATALIDNLSKRVDNLKMDLGELSNAMTTYLALQEEHKALRAQIQDVRRKTESLLAEQSSRETADIHWHLTPDPR